MCPGFLRSGTYRIGEALIEAAVAEVSTNSVVAFAECRRE